MYKLLKTEGHARRAEFETAHGTVQTPVFMNVGTQAAIKGGLSAEDLKSAGICKNRSVPYHEFMKAAQFFDKLISGAHMQMICV